MRRGRRRCRGAPRDLLVQLREALDVGLVDDRLVPGRRAAVVLPVERLVDDDALRDRLRVVGVVGRDRRRRRREVRQRVCTLVGDRTFDRPRVGVDQQLGRIETQAALGFVGPVDAVAVALARADAGQVAVPVEERCAPSARSVSPCPLRRRGRARRARRARRRARSSCPCRPSVAPSGNGAPGQTSIS